MTPTPTYVVSYRSEIQRNKKPSLLFVQAAHIRWCSLKYSPNTVTEQEYKPTHVQIPIITRKYASSAYQRSSPKDIRAVYLPVFSDETGHRLWRDTVGRVPAGAVGGSTDE